MYIYQSPNPQTKLTILLSVFLQRFWVFFSYFFWKAQVESLVFWWICSENLLKIKPTQYYAHALTKRKHAIPNSEEHRGQGSPLLNLQAAAVYTSHGGHANVFTENSWELWSYCKDAVGLFLNWREMPQIQKWKIKINIKGVKITGHKGCLW